MLEILTLTSILLFSVFLFILKLYRVLDKKDKTIQDFVSQLEAKEKAMQDKENVMKNLQYKSDEFSDKLYRSYSQLTDLDSLLREINSCRHLKDILVILAKYFKDKYQVPHYVLYTFRQETNELVFYDSNFPHNISEEKKEGIKSRQIPISSETVTKYAHAYAWKRKRSFFIEDLEKYQTSGVELENKNSVNLRSLLIVPLYLRQNFIGTLDLFDYSGNLKLNEQEINQIKIIGDYVAGSIETGFLLDELEDRNRKIQSEKNLLETNRQKLESLYRLVRKINSFSKIDDIISEVFQFLKSNHRVELGFILLVDEKRDGLVPFLPSKEIFNKGLLVTNFLKNFYVPLKQEAGSLYRTFVKKKPVFLKKIPSVDKLSTYDKKIIDAFDLESFAQIPLVVQNKTIGIICVTRLTGGISWNQDELIEINSFCEHVAGAIHNSNLLKDLEFQKEKTIRFLKNILPGELAEELMEKGEVVPMEYESATILFTDFKNFTSSAEALSPEDLIDQLDACFSQFDDIAVRHNFEKLKTIGDSYMAAGGLPQGNFTHPVDACLFAMEIKSFMKQIKTVKEMLGQTFWEIRVGIHTGSVVAGIVGKTKFAYDVWGDTVNVASRMESSSSPGEINLSEETYDKVKRFFQCEYRGKIPAKNKGEMGMYYLKRLRPEFSRDEEGLVPNESFLELYRNLKIGAKIIYRQAG
ncbi:adenylate/guanylate cyclase domain-containing protein [Leptospira idonii]|uniref:Adenylate cyclase n=1 Tax=Leptospira idonii TaxID=1193500 RepID=A0A4R9LXB9_9LEPT|nr:adenylate/guanylate cyclase domain-containing protein [Leptospira idonii]TGN18954.1 adenylate cyclase [Leptospira idonii]